MTASNLPWNATLADPRSPAGPGRGNGKGHGQSRVTIGFIGNAGTSSDHVPDAFRLNGVRCATG